jgi:hypothetical protein
LLPFDFLAARIDNALLIPFLARFLSFIWCSSEFYGAEGSESDTTHLPFLEEAVEVCIPDLDWSEFEKS